MTTRGMNRTRNIGIAVLTLVSALLSLCLPAYAVTPTTVSPLSLTLPATPVNATSATLNVTLTNNQVGPLTISSIAPSGDFLVSSTTCPLSPATLAGGAACTVSVAFKPTEAGYRNGTLTLTDDAADSPRTVALVGTGTTGGPTTVSPAVVSFGNSVVTIPTAAKTVTFRNVSASAITISGINASGDFAVSASTCPIAPATLAAATSCTINVIFTPTALGARSGSLTITDSVDPGAVTVALAGTGVAPTSLSATAVAFGNVVVGLPSVIRTITLTNNQLGPLGLSSLTLPGGGYALDPSTTCAFPGTLAAGAKCNLALTLTPAGLGIIPAAPLTINTNAANTPQTVTLSGTGVNPTTLSAASVAFGNVVVSQSSVIKTISLTNNLLTTLSLNTLTLPAGGYALDSSSTCAFPGTLAAGAKCNLALTLTPAGLGIIPAAPLTITTSATNSPQTITLSGTGVPPTTLSAASVAFGNVVAHQTSAIKTITLTNNQLTTLTISSLTVPGGGYAVDISSTCPSSGTLAAGAKCNIALTLTPSAVGPIPAGSLTISTNAPNSPQNVPLSGTGVTPTTLSLSAVNFGSVVIFETSAIKTLTLTNNQLTPLTISSVGVSGTGYTLDPSTTCSSLATVAPGAKCTLALTLTPAALGILPAGTLSISSDAYIVPQTVSLSGTGIAPVALTPATAAFGAVVSGTVSPAKVLTLKNTQAAPLNITSVVFGGPFALDVATTTCPQAGGVISGTVPGNSSCNIGVTFNPVGTGAVTGQVTVLDSAFNSPQLTALSGTGVVPVTLSVLSLNYGKVVVNTTASKTITLKNNQAVALNFTAITPPALFAVAPATTTCVVGTPLPPVSSCNITLNYTPTSTTALPAGTLLSISDDASGSPQTVSLLGSGVPAVTLSPAPLAFGTVVVNQAAIKYEKVTNNQTGPLTINSITGLSGVYSLDMADTTCPLSPLTLAAGQSCQIAVSLTATATGAQPGSLTITHDAVGSPQSVTLSATAIQPVTFAPTTVAFAAQVQGTTSAPRTVVLTNTQATPLQISGVTITGTNPTDFGITSSCPVAPSSLPAGAHCNLSITFAPTASGTRRATVSVADDAPGSPHTFAISGAATLPVTISPVSITNFTANVGTTSAYKTITITNTSGGPLQFSNFQLNGPFQQTSTTCSTILGTTLAAGASCNLTVSFAPTFGGVLGGQLQVYDNTATSPQLVNLSGTGTNPLTITPASLSFSAQKIGTTSAPKTIILVNHEAQQETFTLATSGDFVANSNCIGGVIAASSSCLVTVNFVPTATALRSGTLTITHTAAIGSPITASLTGSGTTTNPPAAVAVVSPGAGVAGATVNVVISGNGWTHFSPASVISFVDTNSATIPAAITVSSFTALNANQINATLLIDPAAIYGARNIIVRTPVTGGTETAQLLQAFIIANPSNQHVITNATPNFGAQGQNVNVALTAAGTSFVQGTTFANFGDGIVVNSLTINSPTTAVANISISNTTPVGYRTISLMTGGEFAASDPQAFQVVRNNAALLTVNPSTAPQNASLSIALTASGTHFLQDATKVSITGGVIVGNVAVTSLTTATADIVVPSNAALGVQDVTVSTGGEIATLPSAFTVTGATPALLSVLPASGMQGQTLNVEIVGNAYTGFNASAILADFTGLITVNSITVNNPQDVVVNITIASTAPVGPLTARLTSGPAGGATIFPFTFTVTPSSASIVSVLPPSAPQGGQVTLNVTGSNTIWDQGATTAGFYPAPLNYPSINMITINSATSAQLNISVPSNTPPGNYRFYMATGGQIVDATITVYANTPSLTASPANGLIGTTVNVSFIGDFTHFSQAGTLPVISGQGVSLQNFTVTGPTGAKAKLVIDPAAALGPRKITFTTGGEIVTTYFQVTKIPVYILSVWPNHSLQSTTVDVDIVGVNTHFTTGTTQVLFGPQITVNNVTVISPTELIANITTNYLYNGVTTDSPIGWDNIYINTGEEQLIAGFHVDAPASPSLVSVSPSSAAQGAIADITITGSLTHWVSGQTEAIVGAGVTVSNLLVLSPTTATATIAVSPTAPVGGNSVFMITGAEIVSGTGFTVTPSPASIIIVGPQNCQTLIADLCGVSQSSSTPWVISQLQTATLSVVGTGTHWLQGGTNFSFGPGVFIDSLQILSPTTAVVKITVLSSAPVGYAALTTSTDGEVVTLQQAIDIEQGFPILLASTPTSGEQGATMNLQVLGRFTSWQQGLTTAAFNSDITVNSVTVVDSNSLIANITVRPWAYVDTGSPCGHVLTVTTGTEQVVGFFGPPANPGLFCVATGAAQINSVSPLTGVQGSTETVLITGSATNFIAGVTTVDFGDPNFQVGSITVNSPTSLSVPIGISTSASTGYKTVTVRTYGEVAYKQFSFTVDPGVGTLNEAIPNLAEQGVQNLDIHLIGQYTHFSSLSTATFGPGITVNSVSWIDSANLTANISIDPLSYVGGRIVTVTTPGVACNILIVTMNPCQNGAITGYGSEIVTANAFSIVAGPAIIDTVVPGTGNEGQEVVFNITGANTHWAQNFTQFWIPGAGGDLTINSVVINSPTSATVDMSISPTANPGPRSVFMTTAGESLVDRGGFVVTGGVPVVTYLSPNAALPGTSQLQVTINGIYTHWTQGVTTVNFGPGVTVTALQVGDETHIAAVVDVDPAAQIGYRTVQVRTGTQLLTGNFLVQAPPPPPTPYISWESPTTGIPGQTLTINFNGANTEWDPNPMTGTTLTGFASSITINSFQVTSPTTARANITIDPAATASTSSLTLTTPGTTAYGTEVDYGGFTVVVAQPTLSFVDPGSAMQGTQNLTVNVMGQYTNFDATTVFNFGTGITVNGPATILGPTIATVTISVDQLATLGGRYVTATTGGQVVGGAYFSVTPSLATIVSVLPNTAKQGDTLTVQVAGTNTHWGPTTHFSFGNGIVITSTTVNSHTDATLTLAIPALAGLGATWVTAQTSGETASISNGFVVQAGTPLLLSSGPGSAPQQGNVTFTVLSQATQWLANPPTVSYGPGINITNVMVTGNTSLTANGYVQPTTYLGCRDLTVSTPTQTLSLGCPFWVTAGPAVINSISPASAGQGATFAATISGTNTHWQQGVTQLTVPGALINSFTVTAANRISANLTISKYAAAGQISLTATTLYEVANGPNVFTILQTQPELLSVVSASGTQGQTETVTLTGDFTHFDATSTVNFGAGIIVNSVTPFSLGQLQVNITVQPTAALGARNVSVTTGTEVVSLNSAFTVTAGPAALLSLTPAATGQGSSLSLQVVGSQTHFAAGITTASFGGGINVTSLTVVDALHANVTVSVPNSTPIGVYNATLNTGGEAASILSAFSVTVGAPRLSGVSPTTGNQGTNNVLITLTGLFTNFVNGTSAADFGADITVNSTTVSNATTAVASINIGVGAARGSRTVTVNTGAEQARIVGGFTVLAGVPHLNSAAPATAQAGSTNVNVVIQGAFTSFQQGFTSVSFGSGITTNFVTVSNLSQLTANISIDGNAAVGARDINVSTNGQLVTLSSGFTVTPGTPVVTQINPNYGNPSTTVTVNIYGRYTNWVNGTTTVSFGPQISVGGAAAGVSGPVTVNGPESLTASLTIPAGTSLGPVDVAVTTGTEVETVPGGFTVQAAVIPAPYLISLSPGVNAGGNIAINSSIVAVFSQPMNRTTINTGTVLLYLVSNPGQGWLQVPGTVTVDAAGRKMTFTPTSLLAVNSQYYLRLTNGIQDATGNAFGDYGQWVYTIFSANTTAPTVVAANPPALSTVGSNVQVQLEFSVPMDQSVTSGLTVATGGMPVAGTYSWNSSAYCCWGQGNVLYFNPSVPFTPSTTYTVTWDAPLADTAGNLVAPGSFNFTTGPGPDTSQNYTGIDWANYQGGVPANFKPKVVFSKPVNPIDINNGTLMMYNNDSGKYLPGAVALAADALSATFTPTYPLLPNTYYRVHMSWGYYDAPGNYLNGVDGYFYTGDGSDLVPPTVASVFPADTATAVPLNTNIVVHFSEAIDPSTAQAITVRPTGGSAIIGTTSLAGDLVTLTFTPTTYLQPSTPYTVEFNGYKDMAGNVGTPFTSVFTTAVSIPPLILSTGLDAGGHLITTGGQADARWVVVPNGSVTPQPLRVVAPGSGGWYGGWMGNGPNSSWVTIDPTQVSGNTYGTYSTTFDLTGYSLNNLCFVGAMGIDDNGVLLLNGTPITGNISNWGSLTGLNIPLPVSSLNATTNTLSLQWGGTDNYFEAFRLQGSIQNCGASLTGLGLTSTVPAWNATGVATDTTITFNFNNPIDPATVNSNTLRVMLGWNGGQGIAGSYSVTGSQVVFTPAAPFPPNSAIYVGNCSGPYDLAGEALGGCYQYQLVYFITGSSASPGSPAPPPFQVAAFSPSPGTTVGLRTPVVATFNRSYNPYSLNAGDANLFVGDSSWCSSYNRSQDNATLVFACSPMPANATMTANFNSGISDWAGNPLTNFTSQFTTSPPDYNVVGSIIATRPGNGAGGISPNAPLVLFTNLPVDPATASSALQVAQNNVAIPGTVTVLDNGYTIQFTPSVAFARGALIQWWTNSSLNSAAYGTYFYGASGYFWVAADTSGSTPGMQTASPPTNTTVPLNAVFEVQFNTPLDPATVNSSGIILYDASAGWTQVSGTYSMPQPNVARFVPSADLPANHTYYFWYGDALHSALGVHATATAWWYYTSGSSHDSTLPTIVSAVPYNGATNVGVNAAAGAAFSKAIDATSINSTTFQVLNAGSPLPGGFWISSDDRRVLFVPDAPLPASTTLTIALTNVLDQVGNPVSYTSTFQTAAGPDFSQPYLANSSVTSGEGVPLNTAITLQFSESLDVTSCAGGNSSLFITDETVGGYIATTLSWNADQSVAYLLPGGLLPAGHQLRVYVQNCADLAGNSLQNTSFLFYPQFSAAVSAPTVVNFNPTPGSTGVATNVVIQAQFSAPLDPTTLGGVTLTGGGSPVPFTPSLSSGNTVLQLYPRAPLAPGTAHVMTIAGVKDPAGNLVATVTNNFSTGPTFDISGPSVVGYEPPNYSRVGTNVLPKLLFNEPLNPITVSNSTFRMYLADTGQWIPLTTTLSADAKSVTLHPLIPLVPNTLYHYYPCCGYQDQNGNNGNQPDLYFYTGAGTDSTGPSVAISPTSGAIGIPLNPTIMASFSEPIDGFSWNQNSIQLLDASSSPVAGVVTQSDWQTLVFTPAAPLSASMTYTVQVSGVTDTAGNAIALFTSTFTTGSTTAVGGLSIISTDPPWGSGNVSATQPITIVFNHTLNPQSVSTSTLTVLNSWNGSLQVAGTWVVNDKTAVFTPISPYPAGATIYVGTQNRGPLDVLGNYYDNSGGCCANQLVYFTVTTATPDTNALAVASVNPPDHATGVRHDIPVSVTFNKSISPYSIWSNGNNALLFAGEVLVDRGSISMSADNRTMTFSVGALWNNTTYTIALPANGITDQSGNPLAFTFTSTFTTAANPSTGNGNVAHVSPSWNASGVPAATLLTFYPDRPVDPSSLPGNIMVTANGVPYAGSVAVAAQGYEVQFTPTVPFPAGARMQWWFFGGIRDTDGNYFNGNSGYFNTAPAIDPLSAPYVVSISPTNYSNRMPTNGQVDILFSLPIDATTLGNIYFNTGTPITATIPSPATPNLVRITPTSPWPANSGWFYLCVPSSVQGTNGVGVVNQCWDTVLYTTAAPDLTPGTIKIGPGNGMSNVGTNAYLRLAFSKPVDVTSINATTVQVTSGSVPILGTWSFAYSGNDIVGAYYSPLNPLPASSTIQVSISGILDYAGNQFAASTTQFQTAALPDFSSAYVSMDFGDWSGGIATNASFTCRYNKPMDPASIPSGTYIYSEVTGGGIPVTYTFSSDLTSVTMTPNTPLFAQSRYRYYCYYAIDLTGNGQNNDSRAFTTGDGPSSTGPVLVRSNPPSGAINVPLNSTSPWCNTGLGVMFDRPVAENTLGGFTLTAPGGSPIPLGACQILGDTTVMLTMPSSLLPNIHYTINVSGVKDYSGNLMAPVATSFTTGGGYDWAQPWITSFVPADGSTDVSVSTPLSITFNKPMNPITLSAYQIFLRDHNTNATVPTTLSVSADATTVYLTPAGPLTPSNRYDLYMQINNWWITDTAGNTINQWQYLATFTTGTPALVNGVCGSAASGSFASAPNSNLCSAGVPSSVLNNGSWSWTCAGQYGGSDASCSANVTLSAACAPQPAGLVSWWKGEGNASDQVGSNNGVMWNGASFGLGAVGDAFSFNGNNQFVLVGDPIPASLQIQNAITMSAWVYMTAYPVDHGNLPIGVIAGSQTDSTGSGAMISVDSRQNPDGTWSVPPGHIYFMIGDGGWHGTVTQSQVPLNQWTLITATRSANQPAQIYYNGVAQPTVAAINGNWSGAITYNNAWFAIGQQKDENRPFNGLIDEVQMYNRALTASEVLALYNASSTGLCGSGLAPATTALASSQNPAGSGTSVTFTATISPNSATGSVTFKEGAAVLGGPVSLAGGQATFTTASLSAGSHTIVAVYSGDLAYGSSSSAPLTQTIFDATYAQPSGLVSWWPGEGNANDIVGSNNATVNGGVSYAAGEVGQAFRFDGSSGYLRVPGALNVPATGPISFAAWVKYDSSSSAGVNPELITVDGPSACGAGILHGIAFGGKTSVAIARGCGGVPNFNCGTATNIGDNLWHFVVTGWDGTNSFIYIDGAQKALCPGSDFTRDTSYVSIGGRYDQDGGNSPYNGMADEVQIYNRALTPSEITALYTIGTGGARACAPQPGGLVSWWRAEGNATDQVGGNNGTLVNGATFAPGEVGSAFSFNGANQYVLIGSPVPASLEIQNEITLSAWIYATGLPGDLGLIAGSQHDGTGAGATIFLDARTNPDGTSGVPPGHIHFQIGDGSWHATNSQSIVPLNQWVLITATRSAGNPGQIYYNGVLQPSTSQPWASGSISYSGAWFAIGQQSDLNRPFNGLIDEVQVYSRALGASEVQGIYNAGTTGMCH